MDQGHTHGGSNGVAAREVS
ncbi:uncharacterized protein G2W53_007724 [Senna tora]|uniref:Uncharacterized protein n=1 Tax=Senna tora TaxID=362788 RepID=A0A834X792_9FABA|nr:uncharacterized protein G2W53_007722 [Senna tora]KAF7839242.1 uncharacterized protein G2W53_007724 [Senna tora]